ncbi:hypothetical protein [Streptomyces sp. MST-110588]|uniref:hypothetical protein n=1 Tax=Streptomyces sp. MST-110588 TaxID=2833628 RepID=UPI001F5E1E63|nr:hypothetical protein [Streptomyces sp. MST-110588]UNO44438.1 hypothetical protein KGS77_27090 [Streptomyces sp. MST-110588]
MTKYVKAVTSLSVTGAPTGSLAGSGPAREPESMDQLRGDCARMAPHWKAERQMSVAPKAASDLHGISIPAASAALVDGMSDYGD